MWMLLAASVATVAAAEQIVLTATLSENNPPIYPGLELELQRHIGISLRGVYALMQN